MLGLLILSPLSPSSSWNMANSLPPSLLLVGGVGCHGDCNIGDIVVGDLRISVAADVLTLHSKKLDGPPNELLIGKQKSDKNHYSS